MSPPSKKARPGKRSSEVARPTPTPPARRRAGKRAEAGSGGGTRRWRGALAGKRLAVRIGWWVAVGALLLPPFVLLAGLRDPFRLPKMLLAELLVPLSLVFLSFGLRRVERIEWRRVAILPAVRALVPLWLVAATSAVLSPHPRHSQEALWSMSIGTLAVLAWSVGLPRKRQALDLLLIPAVVLAVIAVLQHHEVFRPFELARQSGRFEMSSLAGNVGDLGAYLVLPLLVAQAGLVRALAAGRKRLSAGAVVISLLFFYTLLIGQTLSAIAAALVSTALFWLLRAPSLVGAAARWRLPVIGGAVAAAVLGLLLVEPARERVQRKIQEVGTGSINDALTGRLDGWRAGADMLARNPLLGVGPGGYRAEFASTKLAMIEDGARFWWGHGDGSLFVNAHNEVIELGAELGAIGLLALGWGAVVVLAELRRRPLRSLEDRVDVDGDRRALEWAGLAALAVLSMTYFPMRTALVAYPFLLLLAWVLEPRDVEDVEASRPQPPPTG